MKMKNHLVIEINGECFPEGEVGHWIEGEAELFRPLGLGSQ